MTTTNTQIREYLGHGRGNRKVRIKRDGGIEYYGSIDPFDRRHDYWHYAGSRAEIMRDMESDASRSRWLESIRAKGECTS